MSATIFRDVGYSLRDVLLLNGLPEIDEGATSLKSPAEIDDPSPVKPIVTIFLYHFAHNSTLRNMPPIPDGLDKLLHPPVTLDLYYLITAYAKDKVKELRITESIIRTLTDFAVLKGGNLSGNLSKEGISEIRIVPHTLSLDDQNKLWSTFPNKPYKLSAAFILTPVTIPSSKPPRQIRRGVEFEVNADRYDKGNK